MDLSLTELYLSGVLVIVTFLYLRSVKKYEQTHHTAQQFAHLLKEIAEGRAFIVKNKEGHYTIDVKE